MKRLNIKTIVVIIGILFCLGCASPGIYLKNRTNDFVDCFKADVGVGFGVDVQVKATEYIATGVGFASTSKIGFRGRYTGQWNDTHIGFPVYTIVAILYSPPLHLPVYMTDMAELENLPKGISATSNFSIIFINTERENIPAINQFDIELGGTALFIGAKVGFSFGQLFDFILGIAGIDIANDDEKTEIAENKERQEPNK